LIGALLGGSAAVGVFALTSGSGYSHRSKVKRALEAQQIELERAAALLNWLKLVK
jgi:hypothetical protein